MSYVLSGRRRATDFGTSCGLALISLGLVAQPALADLTPPVGNAVTAGLMAGAVSDDAGSRYAFVDTEGVWTHYPSDFASGLLTPGFVLNAGYEFESSRVRITPAAKLGILYFLSLEAGYAFRLDGDSALSGPSARVRVSVPLNSLFYVSAYVRTSALSDNSRDDELGVGLKFRLWGDSYKLEGALNR